MAANVTRHGPKKIIVNGAVKMSVVEEILRLLRGHLSLCAREDMVLINVSYNVAEILALRNQVKWYGARDAKFVYPSLRFGLRRNTSIREQLSTEPRRRPPTKLAIAETVLLR